MSHADAAALCETYRSQSALANEVIPGPGCLAVRNDDAPEVYDANFLQIEPHAELDSAFAFLEENFGERSYRSLRTDPDSPPAFHA
jgi:hypothetical protein